MFAALEREPLERVAPVRAGSLVREPLAVADEVARVPEFGGGRSVPPARQRTRGPCRASRAAARAWRGSVRSSDVLPSSDETTPSTLAPSLKTAAAASSEAPPSNTVSPQRSCCSRSSSTSHDHSSVARSERCRGGRSPDPSVSTSRRRSRRDSRAAGTAAGRGRRRARWRAAGRRAARRSRRRPPGRRSQPARAASARAVNSAAAFGGTSGCTG